MYLQYLDVHFAELQNVFNSGATASHQINKQKPQLDSVCRICPGCMSHEVLIVVVDVSTGGEVCWAELEIGPSGSCRVWGYDSTRSIKRSRLSNPMCSKVGSGYTIRAT